MWMFQATRQNLEEPVKGEAFEKDVLYPDFIRQAESAHTTLAIKAFNMPRGQKLNMINYLRKP